MSNGKRPGMQRPGRGQRLFPAAGVRPGRRPVGQAPFTQRDLQVPGHDPLEGKILRPRDKGLAMPRQRGRWLTTGVPAALGAVLGFSTFIVFGVSSLIGGAGLLAPLLAGLGVAVVFGGGSAFLLRNRDPKPVRLAAAAPGTPQSTRTLLEKVVRSISDQRRRLARVRRRASGATAKQALHRADALLLRINALVGSGSLQSRRPFDTELMALEGMATRYVPDLIDALETTVASLDSFEGEARTRSLANLQSIEQQLTVLDENIGKVEHAVADGVTRSLDVHSEFLKARFADQQRNPVIDV